MEDNILVSVIVPVYQAEAFLERTIHALREQTLREIEIILIDDGSKDRSGEICDHAAVEDSRIRCIHKANGGVSAARNDGMTIARGEYLMFCDADDIPHPEWAMKLYRKAVAEQADVVLSGFTRHANGNDMVELFPYKKILQTRSEIVDRLIMPMCVWGYAPYGVSYQSIYGSVCRGIYRKAVLDHICFPENIRLGEDLVFNTLFWSKSRKIAFIQDPLYDYCENPNSATHTNGRLMWSRYLETWNAVHSILEGIPVNEEQLRWHNFQLCRYAINAIVEGVCSQNWSFGEKKKAIRAILQNSELQTAKNKIPTNVSKKNRIILEMMIPSGAAILLVYYQLAAR